MAVVSRAPRTDPVKAASSTCARVRKKKKKRTERADLDLPNIVAQAEGAVSDAFIGHVAHA
jgi:hypothetical protein